LILDNRSKLGQIGLRVLLFLSLSQDQAPEKKQ
jgi:hypothetical protein